jgi:hypothetical protein
MTLTTTPYTQIPSVTIVALMRKAYHASFASFRTECHFSPIRTFMFVLFPSVFVASHCDASPRLARFDHPCGVFEELFASCDSLAAFFQVSLCGRFVLFRLV